MRIGTYCKEWAPLMEDFSRFLHVGGAWQCLFMIFEIFSGPKDMRSMELLSYLTLSILVDTLKWKVAHMDIVGWKHLGRLRTPFQMNRYQNATCRSIRCESARMFDLLEILLCAECRFSCHERVLRSFRHKPTMTGWSRIRWPLRWFPLARWELGDG